ncbi:carbohydrate sulfotransferase 1-like isoform X4 [Dendroctonus ponderosae]|uniref:carbohydrate sulfotransferase 1-like isoform X4 n=1 Tax=Dendroctonus ponderosae TaxID=77166 RepID=UPI0020363577|nr:carbohydrate sulfotransferase 1-like isoform X4 [Dendroctonus ponderosae]
MEGNRSERSFSVHGGDVLNALPGNYYHYEPLMDYGIIQIRGPPDADSALTRLKSLLNCDYTNLYKYIEYATTHNNLLRHNKRLWAHCEADHDICWDREFLNQFCRLFPFQSVKTVRLRLKLAEALLEVKSLNVKVILLIRDPRGTLQSRKHRDWCPGEPDCDQPNYLCSDMVSDYSAAIRLKELYPSRFRALRYEDICLNPYEIAEEVFNFIGITLHPQVITMLVKS